MKTKTDEHLQARVCAIKCYYQADEDMAAAMGAFEKQWNEQHLKHTISDVRAFIKLSVSKLEEGYSLRDAGGQGRKHTLSEEDALVCAELLAKGYWQEHVAEVEGVSRPWGEYKQYTSLSEALAASAGLRKLTTDKGMKQAYVERRLHEVARWLTYGKLPMKLPLSPKAIEQRLQYCRLLLRLLEEDPDFLMRVFWVDECRIWFNKDLAGKLMVWYDRRKLDGQPPMENPLLALHGTKRIDFILILNARLGCVYVEFLTGTTDIDEMGRRNPGMRQHMQTRKQWEALRTDLTKKLGTGCYRVSQM